MNKFNFGHPYIVLVKGISGSGKSTRVFHLIQFIKSLGEELTTYKYVNIDGIEVEVGYYSKTLNLLFVGKMYEKNNVEFWQGYDVRTGHLCGAKGTTEFLKEMFNRGISVLIEGAGITGSNRLRPLFLFNEIGYVNHILIRYDYADGARGDYEDRIMYRSGKEMKTNSMWSKLGGFKSDIDKSIIEGAEVEKDGCFVYTSDMPFDAPKYDLGVKLFDIIGISEMNGNFIEFSATVPDNKFVS